MKRLLLYFSIFIILLLIWYGESRKFFCLDSGECVTVWKSYNNVCYIIPGKYYGLIRPSKNYIESPNTNNVTIFFTKEMSNAIIYNSEQNLTVKNIDKHEFVFYDYNSNNVKFDQLLYLPNAKLNKDVKNNVGMIQIFIHENYATDKNGRKL